MPGDLESRRLAIAAALRAIMAEPLPPRTAASQPVSAPPAHPELARLTVDDPDPADDTWDHEWDDEDFEFDDADRIPRAAAGVAAGMSRRASLALFGHA